ncbi:MAG: hypothetical protein ACYTEL_19485 [Planctomycetota bacterium]
MDDCEPDEQGVMGLLVVYEGVKVYECVLHLWGWRGQKCVGVGVGNRWGEGPEGSGVLIGGV